jgi:putative ABC transport system permease protein
MAFSSQIITTSIAQAFGELRANKLRTTLSLTGVAIGIFCIVAVLTVLNTIEDKVSSSMSSLGSDVLYINRNPWMPDGGEYKWWEYLQRKPLGKAELTTIQQQVQGISTAAICYAKRGLTIRADDQEVKGAGMYAVTNGFERIQNVEVQNGRYLGINELDAGSNNAVIGHELSESLFGGRSPVGKTIQFNGRSFHVVGVMRKEGQNMAGFNFDDAIVISYATASSIYDVGSRQWGNDPLIMVKATRTMPVDELKDEVVGVLRRLRRVRPEAKDDFAVNQLSQIAKSMDSLFGTVNFIGVIIGLLSLVVGAFGIANIMFVTVRERTKIIGLKKAIGARRRVILTEFLVEAITLCVLGGMIGILLVGLLGLLLGAVADFNMALSFKNVSIGILVSAFVGTVSGIVPAIAASRLDPVVAIRST